MKHKSINSLDTCTQIHIHQVIPFKTLLNNYCKTTVDSCYFITLPPPPPLLFSLRIDILFIDYRLTAYYFIFPRQNGKYNNEHPLYNKS